MQVPPLGATSGGPYDEVFLVLYVGFRV
jgi:hypothetical protein